MSGNSINDIRKDVVSTLSKIESGRSTADINGTIGAHMLVTPVSDNTTNLVTGKLYIKNTLFSIDSGNLTIG
jgi:hypothetical protein